MFFLLKVKTCLLCFLYSQVNVLNSYYITATLRCVTQDELVKVDYGSDVDKTQTSLDQLRRLQQTTQHLHPEVQTCCSYKVPRYCSTVPSL